MAYIPARAGSKRIPRKNVRFLGGKPVLARVIESIKRSKVADRIVVSTDDRQIKRIAEAAGAEVLTLRSAKLADDHTPFRTLLKKDAPRYLRAFGMRPEKTTVLFALATAALTDPATYRLAYKAFKRKKASVLVATRPFTDSPYRLAPYRGRAQEDSGLFYFLDYKKAVSEKKHWFLMKGLCCYPVSSGIAVDVDTEADWRELEKKYKESRGTRHR